MKGRLEEIKNCDLMDAIKNGVAGRHVDLKAILEDVGWLISTAEEQQKEIKRLNNRVEFRERISKDSKNEIVHLQNELVKAGEEIERLRTVEQAYEALKKAL